MSPLFRFPEDLIPLQRAWQQTYADPGQVPAGAATATLRRRLTTLSGNLCTPTPTGRRRAGVVKLRRAARTPTSTKRKTA
ncbi:hypothetical protein EF912_04735 [Streptomyces sp. WAC07061]|uniref:hypothetical protein n=1 Tax=Streptomyces sp. WAC07061 TaxID=2487410 RepID=UPI000F7769A8|nr:hypothetical protein [Streptomyces sp. WAC07061]RSS62728.1 hypothetical protein EF912_04735 [Streptomyces sp. WAC07061]